MRAGNQVCSRCHAGAEEGCFRREDFCKKIFTGPSTRIKIRILIGECWRTRLDVKGGGSHRPWGAARRF